MGLLGGLLGGIGGLVGGAGKMIGGPIGGLLQGISKPFSSLQGVSGRQLGNIQPGSIPGIEMSAPQGGLLGKIVSPQATPPMLGATSMSPDNPMPVQKLAQYYEGNDSMIGKSAGLATLGRTANDVIKSGLPKIDAIKGMISQKVQEVGSPLSAAFYDKMAQIESGFNPSAGSPTGAKGLFQFTGNTWKGYGQGSPLDPEANTVAAIKLANNNYNYLQTKLNRAPLPAEVYMAHNIGPYGAYKLLTADPHQAVSRGLINSNPAHNPMFLMRNKTTPLSAGEALQRYYQKFEGI